MTECSHCGATFQRKDGVPALFPITGKTEVTFTFTHERSTRNGDFTKCFSYPERSKSTATKPYHLDDAHLAIIERLPKQSVVLEIGCGGAQMRKFIEGAGHEYIGVDISKARVDDKLQSHGGPDMLCDAHFLPFASQSFDLVYTSALTEHVACPYLIAQQVARCLKPGGYYLGNVAFLEPWHDDSFFHMTPLGVFEVLTQAKLDIKHIWPGVNYSGFHAILYMGNKATKPLTVFGDWVYALYKLGSKFRRKHGIETLARISGATDWIASKPLAAHSRTIL